MLTGPLRAPRPVTLTHVVGLAGSAELSG